MKKLLVPVLLLSGFNLIFAQSSRPKIEDNLQKANKRPAAPASEVRAKPENKAQPAADESNAAGAPQTGGSNARSSETLPDDGDGGGEVLRVDTNLVTIPVRVSDRNGRFLGNLVKEDFQIYEDNKPQEIAYFSRAEEPFTVALVLDMSYSSAFKIGEIHSAAIAFVSRLHRDDKVMIVSFDQEVRVLCEPTNDRERLASAIKSAQIASGTSLYEAIDLVVNERLKKIAGRKAIVLFTDGVDTTSRRAYADDNLRDAEEGEALIYPIEYDTFSDVQAMKDKPIIANPGDIGTGGGRLPGSLPGGAGGGVGTSFPFPFPRTGMPSPPSPRTGNPPPPASPLPFPIPPGVATPGGQGTSAEDYRKAQEYLEALAVKTGGRVYRANTTANLAQAFTNIAEELRQIYSLGFYPAEEKPGKRRQLKVRVGKSGAVVRARDSYVAGQKTK